jgi:RNA 2',3'-cyclic 3'-phosphodiesterase
MERYRLFIAVEVAPEAKTELAAMQQGLRGADAPVKWVAPEAMHLTLHFLGETDVAILPRLRTALGAALDGFAPVELRIEGAGVFPNMRRPSVVWAGVGGATAELERAQAALGWALESLGLPRETRPFRPHLTVGRVRRDATPAQLERLAAAVRALPRPAPIAWLVERVVLFRSELRPSGPVYTEIVDFRL